jgi:DNA (cytosine-5)-methyltransferase 1
MSASARKTGSRKSRAVKQEGAILDLFAGAGGWEEALRPLALSALGVELEPWACATAEAAGHARLQADLSTLDPRDFAPLWGLVGSPPCQAYSTAGKGLGKLDKPLVIACAHELAAGNDTRASRLAECRDPRSLLTVEPLRFALALRPRWVALEQVPGVLELWSLFAQMLSTHGYHATAGVLSAERFGVPQTRKRAFLIASLDGPVALPEPTHRSYSPRRRQTPAEQVGLPAWVSMADALGFGPEGVVETNNQTQSGRHPRGLSRPLIAPAHTLDTASRSWTFKPGHGWALRNGNQCNSAVRRAGDPAPTMHFGNRANQVEWVPTHCVRQRGARGRTTAEPALTMLASGPAKGVPVWTRERPTTTVTCDRRVHPPGHKENRSDPPGRYQQRRGTNAVRVTVTQAAILQGFRCDYPWQGSRTRQFAQVGNAVPPPLARRVLEAAIRPGGGS